MTYENFKQEIISKDESVSSKDVKSFTIKYALMLFLSAFSISFVISSIIGNGFSVIFMVLTLFLYIWRFDILVESHEYFLKLNKLVKFWWLITLLVVISCILTVLFVL